MSQIGADLNADGAGFHLFGVFCRRMAIEFETFLGEERTRREQGEEEEEEEEEEDEEEEEEGKRGQFHG